MTRESFEIAITEDEEEREEPYTFHFSDAKDVPIVVYPPTGNQIMLLMSLAARGPRELGLHEMGSAFNLLTSMLDEDSRQYVEWRMQENTLQFSAVFQIFEKLIELVAGRPTEQSSDSTRPPSTTGKPSAGPARRAASTRSKSPSRRSATSSTRSSSTTSASTATGVSG